MSGSGVSVQSAHYTRATAESIMDMGSESSKNGQWDGQSELISDVSLILRLNLYTKKNM